jgi:hypothetical protein
MILIPKGFFAHSRACGPSPRLLRAINKTPEARSCPHVVQARRHGKIQPIQTALQRRVRVFIDRIQRIVGHDGIASEPRNRGPWCPERYEIPWRSWKTSPSRPDLSRTATWAGRFSITIRGRLCRAPSPAGPRSRVHDAGAASGQSSSWIRCGSRMVWRHHSSRNLPAQGLTRLLAWSRSGLYTHQSSSARRLNHESRKLTKDRR